MKREGRPARGLADDFRLDDRRRRPQRLLSRYRARLVEWALCRRDLTNPPVAVTPRPRTT